MTNYLSASPLREAAFIADSVASQVSRGGRCDAVVTDVDGVTLATVSGSVDATSAADFDAHLRGACGAGTGRLVLDMSAVEFLSVEGMSLLHDAARRVKDAGGSLAVSGGRAVSRPLRRTGLTGLIPVFDWLPKAFDAVAGDAPADAAVAG